MKRIIAFALLLAGFSSGAQNFTVIATGDIRGKWFDSTFVASKVNPSILSVSEYVKEVKSELGAENVLLIDMGGQLDGQDAAFYYSEVKKDGTILPKIALLMGYDAMIEHEQVPSKVLKDVRRGLKKAHIPYVRDGKYKILKKGGYKIAVLGSEDTLSLKKLLGKKADIVIMPHGRKVSVSTLSATTEIDPKRNARYVARADISSERIKSGSIMLSALKVDEIMKRALREDFLEVKAFETRALCDLPTDLVSREAYKGRSPYMDFYHSLALEESDVDLSLTGPLHIDGVLGKGIVRYADISTLYPFENSLMVIAMTGEEVRKYLEMSYNSWICSPGEHVLLMKETKDYKTGELRKNFAKSPGNFDSAAGICYTVDVSKPYGSRVVISSMADGSEFNPQKTYNVAITSYRATGSGGLLGAAGMDSPDKIEARIIRRGPTFREILYRYIVRHGGLNPSEFSDEQVVGNWKFIPEVREMIEKDLNLIFVE